MCGPIWVGAVALEGFTPRPGNCGHGHDRHTIVTRDSLARGPLRLRCTREGFDEGWRSVLVLFKEKPQEALGRGSRNVGFQEGIVDAKVHQDQPRTLKRVEGALAGEALTEDARVARWHARLRHYWRFPKQR